MFIIQLLIFQAMIFVALVAVLKGLMGRHATTATAHLQGLTQEYLRKHEELKKRLEENEKHHQELLAKAQEEAHQLKDQALKEAEIRRQELVEEAHREAERIMQQAAQSRQALQDELKGSMEIRTLNQACELIQKILPQELRQVTHAQWVDELIRNGKINEACGSIHEKVQQAGVISAIPLTSAQRERLLQKLQTALGYSVTLQENVDPNIIAGLTITLGHWVLDGSLASKLREGARHAEDSHE